MIHVTKLEEYNPGYKDRHFIWCRAYFKMVNADPDFEMLDEIDKWRFMAFVMVELQTKKPLPEDTEYWIRKGFNLKRRPLKTTIKELTGVNLVEVVGTSNVTEDSEVRNDSVTHIRLEKNRIDQSRVEGRASTTKNHKEAITYFCDEYEKWAGVKYNFKGAKDATNVKRLLDTYGFDGFKKLTDQIFISSDSFVSSTDRGIGVMYACSNKLMQEAQGGLLSQLSPEGRATAMNAARALKELEAERAKE